MLTIQWVTLLIDGIVLSFAQPEWNWRYCPCARSPTGGREVHGEADCSSAGAALWGQELEADYEAFEAGIIIHKSLLL